MKTLKRITVMLSVALAILLFSGCSKSPKQEEQSKEEAAGVIDIAEDVLEEPYMEQVAKGLEIATKLEQAAECSINETDAKGKSTMTISAPDMVAMFEELTSESAWSDVPKDNEAYQKRVEDIMNQISARLAAGQYKTVTKTIEVELDESGNPIMTYELVDAMNGGLLSLQEILFERYENEMSSSQESD